jgi:transposase
VPRPRTAMRKIRDILRLTFGEELSRRQVSASLGIPVSTIVEHLGRAKLAGLSWPLPVDFDDAALERALFPPPAPSSHPRPLPDWGHVHKELRRKSVTLQLLWLEYRETHPDGYGYSQFANLYKAWRKRVDVVMRQVHRAGEKLFVDFPGQRVPIYDEGTGAVGLQAELFVAVLGASNYLYAEAFPSQELLYWVTGHVHAFEAMAGCPDIVVCDNLRSGVTKAHRYEPDVNATYQEMAAHYGVAIIPARPYKPRDKAKVEAGVLLAERWIIARLRHRRFTSIGEANAAIAACVVEINARPFKKMDGSRESLFRDLDAPALRPLPAEPYRFAYWKKAKVNIDYHVDVESHYYSVPYQLVGQVVEVRLSATTVEMFCSATTRPIPPTCPSPIVVTPSGRLRASSRGRTRPARRQRGWSKRSWPDGPIPNRAIAPPSGSSAWATAMGQIGWKRPVPGLCTCGPTPTNPSSRYSSTRSIANRFPMINRLFLPIPRTATSAVRATTNERTQPCLETPPLRACGPSTSTSWPRASSTIGNCPTMTGSASKNAWGSWSTVKCSNARTGA